MTDIEKIDESIPVTYYSVCEQKSCSDKDLLNENSNSQLKNSSFLPIKEPCIVLHKLSDSIVTRNIQKHFNSQGNIQGDTSSSVKDFLVQNSDSALNNCLSPPRNEACNVLPKLTGTDSLSTTEQSFNSKLNDSTLFIQDINTTEKMDSGSIDSLASSYFLSNEICHSTPIKEQAFNSKLKHSFVLEEGDTSSSVKDFLVQNSDSALNNCLSSPRNEACNVLQKLSGTDSLSTTEQSFNSKLKDSALFIQDINTTEKMDIGSIDSLASSYFLSSEICHSTPIKAQVFNSEIKHSFVLEEVKRDVSDSALQLKSNFNSCNTSSPRSGATRILDVVGNTWENESTVEQYEERIALCEFENLNHSKKFNHSCEMMLNSMDNENINLSNIINEKISFNGAKNYVTIQKPRITNIEVIKSKIPLQSSQDDFSHMVFMEGSFQDGLGDEVDNPNLNSSFLIMDLPVTDTESLNLMEISAENITENVKSTAKVDSLSSPSKCLPLELSQDETESDVGNEDPCDPNYNPALDSDADSTSCILENADVNKFQLDENNNCSQDGLSSAAENNTGVSIAKYGTVDGCSTAEDDTVRDSTAKSSSPNKSALDDAQLTVPTSKIKGAKKYFCFYCKKLVFKMARHLEMMHRNEEDVKKFSALPVRNRERRKIIETIVRNGNCLYNRSAEYNSNKDLLVTRRPNAKYNKEASNFGACSTCKGYFSKGSLRHHVKKCSGKSHKYNRNVLVMSRKVIGRIHEEANHAMAKYIFPHMNEDSVCRRIRYDRLIILFGNSLCDKFRTSHHHHPSIRYQLRLLGRFMLEVDKILQRSIPLEDMFDPQLYKVVATAVEKVAVLTEDMKHYETPSNAANLGTFIKKAGDVLIADCIEKKNPTKQEDVKNFVFLLTTKFSTTINKTVNETQMKRKREKAVILPSKNDIQKFNSYLSQKHKLAKESLEKEYSYSKWLELMETSLILIITFCRRRPGEIERATIAEYKTFDALNTSVNKEIFNTLTEKNKSIAQNYVRFIIRGKKNRQVPVILNKSLVEAINLIINFRKNAGVLSSNEYIFGLPSSSKDEPKFLRACNLMRKFSLESGVSNPKSIRATALRKQAATEAVAQELSDNGISMLAEFLGHSEKVQKEHYRQPVLVRDVVQMATFFEQAMTVENSNDSDYSESDDSEEEDLPSNGQLGVLSKETSNVDFVSDVNLEKESLSEDSLPPPKRWKSCKEKPDSSRKNKTEKRSWTLEEKQLVIKAFSACINNHDKSKLPSLNDIRIFQKKHSLLSHRNAASIKTWLHNQIKIGKTVEDILNV